MTELRDSGYQIPTPTSSSKDQWSGKEQWSGRRSGEYVDSLQPTPPRPTSSVKRKSIPSIDIPQDGRSTPSGLSLRDMNGASHWSMTAGNGYNDEDPTIVTTPNPTPQIENVPFRPRVASQAAMIVDEQSHSQGSSGSFPRIEEEEFEGEAVPEQEGLQYHAFDDAPKKQKQRFSHKPTNSVGSNSSASDHRASQQLGVPKPVSQSQRPVSRQSLGAELRGRTLSPLSANGSEGSSVGYPRDLSNSRRSPASRPTSYVNLLNNVPYHQQIPPSGLIANRTLQSSVGSAASLLDTKKTLEMYRANVKKTTDLAVQYEFAIYMVTSSQDPSLISADLDPLELIAEAKHILQRLADKAYPFAQYYLGDGYFSGLFNKNKPDHDKAFPLFIAASKHGHAEAGFRAALCYEFGWGTAKSYPKAIQFYRASASRNHPGAATRLGLACLRNDMGLVGRDKYREGLKWLKRAQEGADFQYNSAPYELGLLHLTGFGDDIFKDESYAAQLFTQSAELGHPEANFLMGQAYENGKFGCPRDAALSVHFYNGAAGQGHAEAMLALTAWYMVGAEPVLDRDEAEAFEWARRAAETGFPKAEYALGYFTEMGIGCRRDPLGANFWYVQAADKGNETAKQRLKIIHEAASGASSEQGGPVKKADVDGKKGKKFMGIF
ncbi:Chitin synthase 4 [Vermiconidia calcicola]|uniref:Chitin synthase 4 n=1 Tax=Vermiconidia calcicola TaxID=1690605 RepID=A0ACC3NPW9_9PEZI|nr:Chitin synthase 4 [Vermiconidia calcicola]